MYVPTRQLHSFPSRRSPDLDAGPGRPAGQDGRRERGGGGLSRGRPLEARRDAGPSDSRRMSEIGKFKSEISDARSEEHTSELQSRLHTACRLLLDKKTLTNT